MLNILKFLKTIVLNKNCCEKKLVKSFSILYNLSNYQEKYLKYKNKYLKLRNNIISNYLKMY